MIVKVAPKRRDGKSSFEDLGEYLTEGIKQSGEPPLKTNWDDLTQYITQQSVLDAMGDDVEKTIAVEIGNLLSLGTAPQEMEMVARENPRAKDPVYHYILSWPEHERPAVPDIFKAARHTLKALGLEEHQYIIAIHANTDNLHAHIEVNRIHPKTYASAELHFAHATLHKAAREAEIEFGWSHDNGIYEVVVVEGVKHIVKASERAEVERLHGNCERFEVWNGEQSLLTWCKGEPAAALKVLLAEPSTSSWQDLHGTLARFGLELRDSGGGGMKIFDRSESTDAKQGKPLSVSASGAFRFIKRADLEARFGAFEARAVPVAKPETTYKRDPHKRLERRLERQALRDALHARFKAAHARAKADRDHARKVIEQTFTSDRKDRFGELQRAYQAKRLAVASASDLAPQQRKQLHILNRLSYAQQRAALSEEIKRERAQRRELVPRLPVWRTWVEEQAQLGDEAAISALRGMIYQAGRDAKKSDARAKNEAVENSIRPVEGTNSDPYVRSLQNLVWKVSGTGRVDYSFRTGEPGFSDDGNKLTFGRAVVTDEALLMSLRYAAEKWRGGVRVTGGDAVFRERVLRLAVANNIAIKNPELQKRVTELRETVQPARPSMEPAYADIKSLIQARDAAAKISLPRTRKHSYSGTIVGENSTYIVQHLGGRDYVVHRKDAFRGVLPTSEKRATIEYRSGMATVRGRAGRDAGR